MLKRITSTLLSAFLVTLLLVVVTTKHAYAYIDIASGGYMIQVALAVAVSSLLAIKIFWQRLVGKASDFISKIKGSSPKQD